MNDDYNARYTVEYRPPYPKTLSRLTIVRGFDIMFPHPKPCWWFRLWQRLFLGFRWGDAT